MKKLYAHLSWYGCLLLYKACTLKKDSYLKIAIHFYFPHEYFAYKCVCETQGCILAVEATVENSGTVELEMFV